jgi:molybdenum cofactor biosynthesis protein B
MQRKVATVTVSDSRTPSTDGSGATLAKELSEAGFVVSAHAIVPDEISAVRAAVEQAIAEGALAVILTGGTGIAPRDVTFEAVEGLFEKRLDGFGEAFRNLSWTDIGPRAILSRATAGVVRGALVFALPGSPAAVELGMKKIIVPVLAHGIDLVTGRAGHHHGHVKK